MRKRSYFLLIFVFSLLTLHPSDSFAERERPLSCKDVFSPHKLFIRSYIRDEIRRLGEVKFVSEYRFSHGLLALADKLSMFTNSIRHIFQVGSTVLTTDYFSELEWPPFTGTRDELEALVYGFFHKHNELRMNEYEYIFLFGSDNGEESSFPISGEAGFYRFVDQVFLGDENMAIIQSSSVLTNKNLGALKWDKVLKLRKKKLLELQEEKEKLANANEELKNRNTELENEKTELNFITGDTRRNIGDLVESLLQDEVLKAFFRKENRNVEIDHRKNKPSSPLERLTQTQQQDQAYNRSNKVKREFDIILSSRTPEGPGPVIVIEVKHLFNLKKEKESKLDPVDKLLKNLAIMPSLFSKYEGRKFIGGFAFVNYSEAAKQKAQKAGFYLIQIQPKESAIEKINEDNFKPILY